jgi:hypothetical protein
MFYPLQKIHPNLGRFTPLLQGQVQLLPLFWSSSIPLGVIPRIYHSLIQNHRFSSTQKKPSKTLHPLHFRPVRRLSFFSVFFFWWMNWSNNSSLNKKPATSKIRLGLQRRGYPEQEVKSRLERLAWDPQDDRASKFLGVWVPKETSFRNFSTEDNVGRQIFKALDLLMR